MEISTSTLDEEIGLALREFAANLNAVAQDQGDASQIADQARTLACLLSDYRTLEASDPDPESLADSLRR